MTGNPKETKSFSLRGWGPKHVLRRPNNSLKWKISNKEYLDYIKILNNKEVGIGMKFMSNFSYIQTIGLIKLNKFFKTNNGKVNKKAIMKIFRDIVPRKMLGLPSNQYLFLNLIKLAITRSNHEHIYKTDMIRGFQLDSIPWLPKNHHIKVKSELLYNGLTILLNHAILPLIYKFLKFIPVGKSLVIIQSAEYNQAINSLVAFMKNNKYLLPTNFNNTQNMVPYLRFVPKGSSKGKVTMESFRILGMLPKNDNSTKNRELKSEINKAVYNIARERSFVKTLGFYKEWFTFVNRYKNKHIFIITVDIADCFGNIPISELIRLVFDSNLPDSYKFILNRSITTQFVNFGKIGKNNITWKWNHGLLQGLPHASALCELYLSNLEVTFFGGFNRPDCFCFRQVDDFFFASRNRQDIYKFYDKASQILKLNTKKTKSNVNIRRSDQIKFCGMMINGKNYKFKCSFNTTELYKRFTIHRGIMTKEQVFRKNISTKSTNFYFQKAFMSMEFNGCEHVIQNYFESMIYVLLKLDAAIMYLSYRRPVEQDSRTIFEAALSLKSSSFKQVLNLNKSIMKASPALYTKLNIAAFRAIELVFKIRKHKTYIRVVESNQKELDELLSRNTHLRPYSNNFKFPSSLKLIKTCRTSDFR